eukprot:TRINITY_DN6257_c0_g2_i1.p1 TRINITY_DN6257_c0_g2~~TRINITY_DN6257_c0_g2_i1.p1  ORF type:complete len:216 (+),score=53.60 TRINITY_DN6257_c0_g2_i1:127-774(+)
MADGFTGFQEREERLKERFLEIDDQEVVKEGEAIWELWDDDDEQKKEQRERRKREMLIIEEQRLAELEAIQEVYEKANKRVFRRLKNFPEPVPGCHYDGEDENIDDYQDEPVYQQCEDESDSDYAPPRDVQVATTAPYQSILRGIRKSRLSRLRCKSALCSENNSSNSNNVATNNNNNNNSVSPQRYHTDTMPPPSPSGSPATLLSPTPPPVMTT